MVSTKHRTSVNFGYFWLLQITSQENCSKIYFGKFFDNCRFLDSNFLSKPTGPNYSMNISVNHPILPILVESKKYYPLPFLRWHFGWTKMSKTASCLDTTRKSNCCVPEPKLLHSSLMIALESI